MTAYSHSKLSTFENCPYKYKLKYIDKIEPELENTIEAFMGEIVHKVLERLHKNVIDKLNFSKGDLIRLYNRIWEDKFSERVLKVRELLSVEDYKKMGMKLVRDYYDRFYPFDKLKIVGLETEDKFLLKDGNEWSVRIDKLCHDESGNYFVCDYKTNSRMKEQEEADRDRQLAMYSLWVKNKFKEARSVKLVWHMLAFNKEVLSERTDKELEELHEQIIEKIKQIERAELEKNFPANVSKLCEWCLYKPLCEALPRR
jgi:putative RecB family exonuclease